MPWQFDSATPIYAQLVDRLLCRIASGYYVPGSRMDSVRDLATEAGVNPNTMQKALGQLEQQGLLYTLRTAGRFVTEDGEKIQQVRRTLAKEKIGLFFAQMKALGFSQEQILALMKDLMREMEEKAL